MLRSLTAIALLLAVTPAVAGHVKIPAPFMGDWCLQEPYEGQQGDIYKQPSETDDICKQCTKETILSVYQWGIQGLRHELAQKPAPEPGFVLTEAGPPWCYPKKIIKQDAGCAPSGCYDTVVLVTDCGTFEFELYKHLTVTKLPPGTVK